jgi:glyoxylase-like metal-dependent hydrolase (beta-lactamase superfamily II)
MESMIHVSQFGEITQFKMGRESHGQALWEPPGQVFYWTSAYLVDGLLIDTGCPHTAEEFVQLLEGRSLKVAVNTHYHEDHIGANYLLQKKFGLRILASRESIPLINKVPKIHKYQELIWGYPVPTKVELLPDKIETEHFRFDVVPTPGHCKGHVALVEPTRGWCFSGDLYLSAEPKAVRPEEDIAGIARSMQKLVNLKTEQLILFTSLGNVVQDGREALQSCIAYLEDLSQKAKQLGKQGLSASAIRDKLFGRETVLAGITEGDVSAENMIRAALRAKI